MRDFGYTHFSAGDLLREEVKLDTPRGRQIMKAMENGELVPSVSQLVCEMDKGNLVVNFRDYNFGMPVTCHVD